MTDLRTMSWICAMLATASGACLTDAADDAMDLEDDPEGAELDLAPTYTAPQLATAPAIDGALGEYASAPSIALAGTTSTADVRAAWDTQALYVAFDVTDAAQLPASGAETALWNGDGVEVMIDTAFDRSATADQNDYHFVVTSSGALSDARAWSTYTYASGASVRAVPWIGGGGYRVELKVPFSALGVTAAANMKLGFDVAFNDRDTAGGALTSKDFAGLTSFNNPARWGVLVLGAAASPPTTYGTAYYVRTDGGTATQCTGRADAAYPGSGTNQACAWNHPSIALPSSGSARIAGSDTLYIGSGTYQLGSGGFMIPIPSGTTATKRTRILGKPGAPAPKLVGVGGTHRVLNLDGSSNVEIGNLEITDGSDCVYNHSNTSAKCTAGGAWSRGGLYASASTNVWLHDLNIHGMAARAIQAGGLRDWTVERVKMNRNGTSGWNGDISPASSSNSGKIEMRDIEIGWNGCGERVATGEAWACWGQKTGGYGDGLGTAATGGQWLIEDAYVHHNTSDGLDLLYMDGADTSKVTMRRVYSVANAGNQVKVTGTSLIENSVLVGYCTFFKGKYFMIDGDYCRAYGATVLLNMTGNDTATMRHNTLAGEGDAPITYSNGNSADKILIQNNVVVGFPYFVDGSLRAFSAGGAPAAKTFSGNLAWNVASCPSGTICGQNPKLTNMTLAGFDAMPLTGSPAIDAAPSISAVVDDFVKKPRPVGAGPDIGAYEVQ